MKKKDQDNPGKINRDGHSFYSTSTVRCSFQRHLRTAVFFLLLLAAGAGCSSSTDSDDSGQKPGQTVEGLDAELGEGTAYVPENVTGNGLLESDEENHTYTFDADVLADADIDMREGGVLLIAGKALRRIMSINESNGRLTVQTSGDVTLEDAFKEADINWNQNLEFTQEVAEKTVIEFQGEQLRPNKINNGSVEWEYQVGAYKVTGSVDAQGTQAVVKLVMHKDMQEGGVALSTEATIQQINSNADIQIRDHETKSFRFDNPGMSGKVDLSIAAAGGGTETDLGFGPHTMFRFPFTVGPIPVVIAVKVQTVAKLQVHSKASATAKSTISYNGDTGLSYDGTDYKAVIGGGIEVPVFGSGEGDSAPSGFDGYNVDTQYGFAAPVIELELFGNILVPYIRPEFYIGSRFHWAPICKNVHMRYGIKGGMDLRFLGKKITSVKDDIVIVEEKRQDHYSDTENCSEHYDINKVTAGLERPGEIRFGGMYRENIRENVPVVAGE